MKTAREILHDKASDKEGCFLSGQVGWIVEAMEEYAKEYAKSLKMKEEDISILERICRNMAYKDKNTLSDLVEFNKIIDSLK